MASPPRAALEVRQSYVREDLAALGLDALIVTHPPNLRYLTGFSGSAGALVLSPRSGTLVVDFRYVTAARQLAGAVDEAGPVRLDQPFGRNKGGRAPGPVGGAT